METGFKPFCQGRPSVDGATLNQKPTRTKLPVLLWSAYRECFGPVTWDRHMTAIVCSGVCVWAICARKVRVCLGGQCVDQWKAKVLSLCTADMAVPKGPSFISRQRTIPLDGPVRGYASSVRRLERKEYK